MIASLRKNVQVKQSLRLYVPPHYREASFISDLAANGSVQVNISRALLPLSPDGGGWLGEGGWFDLDLIGSPVAVERSMGQFQQADVEVYRTQLRQLPGEPFRDWVSRLPAASDRPTSESARPRQRQRPPARLSLSITRPP
jgi:hypothetical protein